MKNNYQVTSTTIASDPSKREQRRAKKVERLSEKFSHETPRDIRRYNRAERKISTGNPKHLKDYGYNYDAADQQGIQPDSTGHYPSIGDDGLILKGKKHPTIYKTKKIERALGNKIIKLKGEMYSVPRSRTLPK